jgi:hypothetical protein
VDDGGRWGRASSGASSGSGTPTTRHPDHSDTDEDPASLPPGGPVGLPPGLALDADANVGAAAERTRLRSEAATYSPLHSHAKEFVPKCLALAGGRRVSPNAPVGRADQKATPWTTVMMRNVPLSYTCDSLIYLLESEGFSKSFDFVYVPINLKEMLGVGYAFVNLTTPGRAEEFMLAFQGFDGWASSFSKTACSMHWSICQGLSENISRYRNSPLMSEGVPAFYKPVLMKDGVRIPFPKPTKPLGKMTRRRGKARDGVD